MAREQILNKSGSWEKTQLKDRRACNQKIKMKMGSDEMLLDKEEEEEREREKKKEHSFGDAFFGKFQLMIVQE